MVARHELDVQLTKGGQFVAMAASGSQDLSVAANLMHRVRSQWRQRRGVDPGDNDTLHLQPLYDGTINVMLNTRFVLPIAISLDAIHPACVVGDLTRVREKEDCHRIMEWIADAHEGATGMPDDLPPPGERPPDPDPVPRSAAERPASVRTGRAPAPTGSGAAASLR